MPGIARLPRLLVSLILTCAALPLPAAPPPPPEAFGTIPVESDVVLSPDGHWLAWVDHKEVQPRVIMFDVAARKTQRVLAVPERARVQLLSWNDSQTLLIVVGETRAAKSAKDFSTDFYRTIAQDVNGGVGRMLPINHVGAAAATRSSSPPLAGLVAWRTTKPNTVIMNTNECGATRANCLLEVDTRTGQATIIKVGNEHTVGWVVDGAGSPVAREDWDWRLHAYRVFALGEYDAFKEILRKDDDTAPRLAGLLADGSALVLLAANGRPHQAAWALALDGSPLRLLAEEPDTDITGVYKDSYTDAIVGVYASGMTATAHWLDAAAQRRFEVLQRAFNGRHVDVYAWTKDGTKTLALVQTASTPPVYYIVDFTTHRADIAAEPYPELAGVRLGDVKQISYSARDGTAIPAYLTMPPIEPRTPVPLVVLPHAGPQSRDDLQFDWLVQFLASRGYAVLQPQFRGSSGFGQAFQEAGYRQWGGLMQDDVTDGVKAMIEQGIADPRRICIVGAYYGGYAALAGAAFTPDLYACAASISGVSDLPALLREEVPYGGLSGSTSASLSAWKTRIGSPNDANLVAKSPINSVKSIRAPILIIYGTGDGGVPSAQSEQMARALKAAGKDVAVVALSSEDHWLSRTNTRVQVLKELDAFLREHL